MIFKKNKFGSRKKKEKLRFDGFFFDSKIEFERYLELKQMQKIGIIKDLTLQPVFPLIVNGVKLGRYTSDFQYFHIKNNMLIVEEVKSAWTAKERSYRFRIKLFKALYQSKFEFLETIL